jgi:O-antigen/teichoic acid export membrane protein
MASNKTRGDLFFVYAAYSLRYLYLLLLIPFYARVLGPEGYGVVLASLSLMQMIWLFTNWGFGIDGMREIAVAKQHEYAAIFAKQTSGRLILSAIGLLLGGIGIYLSPILTTHWLAGLLAVLLGIVSAYNLGWYFTGSNRPRLAVKLEVLGFILNLALIFSLVSKPDDAIYAIGAILFSGIVSLIVGQWWIKEEVSFKDLPLKSGIPLIKKTQSIFIYSSSAVLLGSSSTFLLSTLSSTTEVGFFGSAERLIGAGLSVMAPLGAIFIPKVTLLFKENEAKAFEYIKLILISLVGVGTLGLLVTFFAAAPIVQIIFGDGFTGSVVILKTMAVIFPFYACSLVFSAYVLIPLHHEKRLAKVTIMGAIVNVVIAIPLAYHYGGFGMAIARLVSEIFVFISLVWTLNRLGIFKQLLSANIKKVLL